MSFTPASLIKRTQDLYLYRTPEGALFGLRQGKVLRVSKELTTISRDFLAMSDIKRRENESFLFYDGFQITVRASFRGGGSCHSRAEREPKRALPLIQQDKNPEQIILEEKILQISTANLETPTPIVIAEKDPEGQLPKRNHHFVGRESTILEISKMFSSGAQQVVIAGLGGMGKSSIALEYLYRHLSNYSFTWWMSGEHPFDSLKEMGENFNLILPSDREDVVLEKVKNWLETQDGWLLVFDNSEKMSDLLDYLPSKGGHIIITTRNREWPNSLCLDTFSPQESTTLLSKLTQQNGDNKAGELADMLGHLPLALTQAAAYMNATKTSYDDYLTLFSNMRRGLWGEESAPIDYAKTVETTWKVSVDKISEISPDSLALLYQAAFLDSMNIPREVFYGGNFDPLTLSKLLHPLQQYSFLTLGALKDTFSVHRLVQTTTRDQLSPKLTEKTLSTLFIQVDQAWSFKRDLPATWKKSKILFWHVKTLCDLTPPTFGKESEKGRFLNELGLYTNHAESNFPLKIKLHEQALQCYINAFGREHEEVAVSLNSLGTAYKQKGDFEKAIDYFNEALTLSERVDGKDHESNAASLDNLGGIYSALEKLPKAIEYYRRALQIREKTLGENDPNLGVTLNNLATVYSKQGNFKQATNYYTRSFNIAKRTYGERHPDVAVTINNLGNACMQMDDYKTALTHFQKALEIYENAFGKQHGDNGPTLLNIGNCYCLLGDSATAIDYLNQALQIFINVYGNEHYRVANTLHSLGIAYSKQGDVEKGADFDKRSTEMTIRIFGEKHPDVAISFYGTASESLKKGDYVGAVNFYTKALDIFKQSYGNSHYQVGITLIHLGIAFNQMDEETKALDSLTEGQRILISIFGTDHRGVASSHSNLGGIYRTKREFKKAASHLSQAIDILGRVGDRESWDMGVNLMCLGMVYLEQQDFARAKTNLIKGVDVCKKHEKERGATDSYLIGLESLAQLLIDQEDYGKAVKYLIEKLPIIKKLRGEDHEDVLHTLYLIAQSYRKIEDPKSAVKYYKEVLDIEKSTLGNKNKRTAKTLNLLCETSFECRDLKNALEYSQQALIIFKELSDADPTDVVLCLNNIGEIHKELGELPESIKFLSEAVELGREQQISSETQVKTLINLAGAYRLTREKENIVKAIGLLNETLSIQQNTLEPHDIRFATTFRYLSILNEGLGEYRSAIEWLSKELALRMEIFGEDDPSVIQTYRQLENTKRTMMAKMLFPGSFF